MKALILVFLLALYSFGADYSEMSTQELLAIAGYVIDEKDAAKLDSELASRYPSMTQQQKEIYQKHLEKKQKKQ